MSATIINSLYLGILKADGPAAVIYTGRKFDLLTEPNLEQKINWRLQRGHELMGVYKPGCGIRTVMTDVGVTLGRLYGR